MQIAHFPLGCLNYNPIDHRLPPRLTLMGTRTNTWDYENMNTLVLLPDGTRVTMIYNVDNRRVGKRT